MHSKLQEAPLGCKSQGKHTRRAAYGKRRRNAHRAGHHEPFGQRRKARRGDDRTSA